MKNLRHIIKSFFILIVFVSPHYLRAKDRVQGGRFVPMKRPVLLHSKKNSYILPAALITYGLTETLLAKRFRGLNYLFANEVQRSKPPKFRIDDTMQYMPTVSVYLLNLAGIKGRCNLKEQSIILGIASLFTAISVNGLKYTVRLERPDKSARNSFPSGHTTIAFMGAEFLRQEYSDVSIWCGIGGYTFATATAMLRIYNNKHWMGDVAFGAGLGILCTRLAYWIYPKLQNKSIPNVNPNVVYQNTCSLVLAPYYDSRHVGLSLFKRF